MCRDVSHDGNPLGEGLNMLPCMCRTIICGLGVDYRHPAGLWLYACAHPYSWRHMLLRHMSSYKIKFLWFVRGSSSAHRVISVCMYAFVAWRNVWRNLAVLCIADVPDVEKF